MGAEYKMKLLQDVRPGWISALLVLDGGKTNEVELQIWKDCSL